MIGAISAILLVFYAGAAAMTAMAWLAVWRGSADFTTLRELTGIGDRAVLSRLFGAADARGRFIVSGSAVLRHRRTTGAILSDLPVHLLFLGAAIWAASHPHSAAAFAVLTAAAAHALVVAGAAILVLVGNRQILFD